MPTVLRSGVSPAIAVRLTADTLAVDLRDGRTVSVPLGWYPRLLHGTSKERANFRLIGNSDGIHWPDLDEDISVENVLAGKPSGENSKSIQRWLKNRSKPWSGQGDAAFS